MSTCLWLLVVRSSCWGGSKKHTPRRRPPSGHWPFSANQQCAGWWGISTPLHTLVRNITIVCPHENIHRHSHQPPPSLHTPILPPFAVFFLKKNVREEKSKGKSPGAGGGENLISSGVLQWVGYWGGCNLIRRGNSMDCEQVSSLRPVTFLMWCGGGGGDSERRDVGGVGAREKVRKSARGRKEGWERGKGKMDWGREERGSLTLTAFPFFHGNREERRSNTYPRQVQLSLGQSQRHIPRLMVHIHRLDHF